MFEYIVVIEINESFISNTCILLQNVFVSQVKRQRNKHQPADPVGGLVPSLPLHPRTFAQQCGSEEDY